MRLKNNVRSPWGAKDSEFVVDEVTDTLRHHIDGGTLTVINEDEQPEKPEPSYDPSEHTVDEVNKHLATLDPDSFEYQSIIVAEENGDRRKGILGDDGDPSPRQGEAE